MDSFLTNATAKMVKDAGFPVHIGSNYCKERKATNETCAGCESEEGCKRHLELALLFLESAMYQPKSFDDHLRTRDAVATRMAEILRR